MATTQMQELDSISRDLYEPKGKLPTDNLGGITEFETKPLRTTFKMPELKTQKGDLGDQFYESIKEPIKMFEEAKAFESGVQTEKEIAKLESQAKAKKGFAESERLRKKELETSPTAVKLQSVEDQLMNTEFIPTKDNYKDLAGLHSLIGVIGWAIGGQSKDNAIQAMSAMNGMLDGYQKGRTDLYKREKDIFETNLKNLKTKSEILSSRLKQIVELSAIDSKAAEVEADVLFAETNATFLKAIKERQGLVPSSETADKIANAVKEAYVLKDKEKQRISDASAKEAKSLADVGPFIRNLTEEYPAGTLQFLSGADDKDKARIFGAHKAIIEGEGVADFVAKNPNAAGALATAKNFIRLDAMKSIQNTDDATAASQKSALLDAQLDEAVKKKLISPDDAEVAKILQKKLFALALSDVQASGQRGSVYLDKKFQDLYDQSSRPQTLLEIIRAREEESNNILKGYRLGLESNLRKELYPLYNEGARNYFESRRPKLQVPPEVADMFAKQGNVEGSGVRHRDGIYRIRNGQIVLERR
jgi:hypothetical protein